MGNLKRSIKGFLGLLLSFVFFLSAFVGCGINERIDQKEFDVIKKELPLNYNSGEIVGEYFSKAEDSYCYMIQLSDDSLEKSIKKNDNWETIPTTDEMEMSDHSTVLSLLWGWDAPDGSMSVSPYLAYTISNALIPEYGTEGYFFYCNHSSSIADIKDDEYKQTDYAYNSAGYVYNFTLAVYDTNNQILYIYKINAMKEKLDSLGVELGADLRDASVIKEYWETNNDKPVLSIYNMTIKDDLSIINNEMWNKLPVSNEIAENQTKYFENKATTIPTIKNGYYFYKNYLEGTEEITDNYDLVLAIYDADSKTLYYQATWYYNNN